MTDKNPALSLYYAIVGKTSNTNQGVARLLAAILLFIVIFGTIAWVLLHRAQ